MQTSYAINIPAFTYPGQLANLMRSRIQTAMAVAAALPYGRLIIRDTANSSGMDQAGKLPSASGDIVASKILGISVADQARAQDPSVVQALYPINAAVPCLKDGEIVVKVEVAVVAGDPVYARFTAHGGLDQLGGFRNDADTVSSVDTAGLVPNAVFESAAGANGFAVVSIKEA